MGRMTKPRITHPCGLALTPARPRGTQAGFSILEVLIAIIILSFGMLGAVGMQAAALQSNKEARYQAMATTFARELAEEMRGNHNIAINPDPALNPFLMTFSDSSAIAAPASNCFTSACPDATAVAVWNVADWQTRVRAALPSPRITVCFDQTPFDGSGNPQWGCTDDGDATVVKIGWTRSNTAGTLEFASSSGAPLVIVPLTAGSPE